MLDVKELTINIIVLTILQSIIHHIPFLQKYNDEIRFNFYRSFMCSVFALIGLNIMTMHCIKGFLHLFSYKHDDMKEAYNLFFGYMIVDLIKMIAMKNYRLDLYLHHILFILTLILAHYQNSYGYLHSALLLCEVISVVSGIDSMALEDNDNELSYKCKKIRKNIIKYIRMPLWIIVLLISIRFTNKLDILTWLNGIIISIGMIYLDKYWENKCDKVITIYEE